MRRPLASLGLFLTIALATDPAFAQSRTAPPTAPTQPPVFVRPSIPLHDPSAPNDVYRAEALQRRLFAEIQTRIAQGMIPKERLERADRVSALIDRGLCGPAAQLARAEHDDAMADRVPETCAAHRTSRHS